MSKYHFNPETNKIGVCRASKKKCTLKPLSDKDSVVHFEAANLDEARKYLEKHLKEQLGVVTTLNKKTKAKNPNKKTSGGDKVFGKYTLQQLKKMYEKHEYSNDYANVLDKLTSGRILRGLAPNPEEVVWGIPQSPKEVDLKRFQERTNVPKGFQKFDGSFGKVHTESGRAADGTYYIGNKEKGYLVYSPYGTIIGESETIDGCNDYLKFEEKGEVIVSRLEDEAGDGPFNSKIFRNNEYEVTTGWSRNWEEPSEFGLDRKYLKTYEKHFGTYGVFGVESPDELKGWFTVYSPSHEKLMKKFFVAQYKVSKSKVIRTGSQVLFPVGLASIVKKEDPLPYFPEPDNFSEEKEYYENFLESWNDN